MQPSYTAGMPPEVPTMYPTMPVMVPHRPDWFLRVGGIMVAALVGAGLIAVHSSLFVGVTPPSDPSQALRFNLVIAFFLMMDIALGLAIFMSFWATSKPETAEGTRRGLLLFGAVFLFSWTFVSLFSLSSFFLRFP